jgi:hypothetical protein
VSQVPCDAERVQGGVEEDVVNTCVTCKWSDPLPGQNGGDQGICRFNPPVGAIGGMTPNGPVSVTVWPTVNMNRDRCSKYEVQLVKPATGFHPSIVS